LTPFSGALGLPFAAVTALFDIVKRIRHGAAKLFFRLQFTAFLNFYGVIRMMCPFGLLQICEAKSICML
jgi:hypothetical protein